MGHVRKTGNTVGIELQAVRTEGNHALLHVRQKLTANHLCSANVNFPHVFISHPEKTVIQSLIILFHI
jgi:hypothetical protein